MNLLLTSVGRRSYLIEYFRDVLRGAGKVIATNTVMAAGMMLADEAYVVRPPTDPGYIEEILEICGREHVSEVFCLHDWEAPFLSSNADRFRAAGIHLAVSRPEVIRLCLDKYATFQFALQNGLAAPKTFASLPAAKQAIRDGSLQFPLIIKLRCGQGSIGLEIVEEEWELNTCHRRGLRACDRTASNGILPKDGEESMLIQERISGVEYGLDVVNDFEGRFACCLVKRKLAMRAGETDAAETIHDVTLENFGRKISESLGHVGVLDVDAIVKDGTPYLLDLNPRFGGHYPFSHVAGANIPAALVAWALGEVPKAEWLCVRPNVKCFKGISLLEARSDPRNCLAPLKVDGKAGLPG